MAVTFLTGFEAQHQLVDGITLSGLVNQYSFTQARTGVLSLRCYPSSGQTGYITTPTPIAKWTHFGLYITTLPSVGRTIVGDNPTTDSLVLNSDGTLTHYVGLTAGGSTPALSTGVWYWIGMRGTSGTGVDLVQVNGVTSVTGNSSGNLAAFIGFRNTEASAADIHIDDVILDNAGFLAPSKVALAVPISDNARATLWTGGTGGTTNLYDAVDNTPPVGSATESNTTQIEHAGGAAGSTDAYDANMTTYTTAGVGASDTVIAIQGLIVWGEDIATGTKLLSYSGVSNPSWTGESSIDVSTGHGSGAVGTYSTGADYWNERRSAIVTSPSVTLGTSPVMRVVRPESASRVASVCFMGMYVAWTPYVAPPASGPPIQPKVYPQILVQ